MSERRIFLLLAWALLLSVFLWSVRPVLSPLVLFLALVYLLTPFFGTDVYRRAVVTLGSLTILWLLHVAGSFLAPFVLALVLAYIADPVVDRLHRGGVRRAFGAGLVLLVALLLVILSVVLLVPLVVDQGSRFMRDLPEMVNDLQAWYRAQVAWLARTDLPLLRDIPFERALEVDTEDVQRWVADRVQELGIGWEDAIGLGRGLQVVVTVLGYAVLTPVLTYYILRDFPSLQAWTARLVPRDHREGTLGFLSSYDQLLGEYLRGQLLVAAFVGLATGLGFWIVGFPNAVLLGVVAGVFNVVPYLGMVVSLVPALLIAFLMPPLWVSLLKVAIIYIFVNALEAYVLSPRIIGSRVGLHPVWVMLAILAFSSFFGFVGLLIAIPLAVLIKLLIGRTVERYRSSVYYRHADDVIDEEVV
ncbi:MAG TPA: AI-2E family transporter [Gemmatimonadota bacterium]|nr:AI-2E family transporter [Gemmatimonadota bacterium]